jgi:hypothetical protein
MCKQTLQIVVQKHVKYSKLVLATISLSINEFRAVLGNILQGLLAPPNLFPPYSASGLNLLADEAVSVHTCVIIQCM